MVNQSKAGQHMNDTRTPGEPKVNSLLILRSPNETGKDVRWKAAWNKRKRRGDQPADGKHRQSHRGSLPLVRPVVQVRVEHSIPDNGGLPGSARLHVVSRPGIRGGGASGQNRAGKAVPSVCCGCALQHISARPLPPDHRKSRTSDLAHRPELSPLSVFIIHSQLRTPSPITHTHAICVGGSETKN